MQEIKQLKTIAILLAVVLLEIGALIGFLIHF